MLHVKETIVIKSSSVKMAEWVKSITLSDGVKAS